MIPRLIALLLCLAPAAGAQTRPVGDHPWRLDSAAKTPDWLDVSGSFRVRYEALHNPFVAGRTEDDEVWMSQSLLKLEAHADTFAAGIELLDARLLGGNETGAAPAETNAIEPIQAYLAWRPKHVFTDKGQLDLTLGRFTLDLGSRRLVARPIFRLLQQPYTGLRAVWSEPKGPSLTLFYTAPVTRLPSDTPSALDNEIVLDREAKNTRFGGALYTTQVQPDLLADLYVYDLNEDDADDLPSRNRRITTWGARLKHPPKEGRFDLELEAMLQAGTSRATAGAADVTDLDHRAHLIHADAGYTFDAPWKPRLALVYEEATGDRDPTDRRNERFDPLFGDRGFDLGHTGIWGFVGRTNFASPGVRLEVKPDARSSAYISWRRVDLDAPRDSFANSGVRDTTGASGKHVGDQIEGRYRRMLIPDGLRLDIGAAYVSRGRFLKQAPNATRTGDPVYAFADLMWTF